MVRKVLCWGRAAQGRRLGVLMPAERLDVDQDARLHLRCDQAARFALRDSEAEKKEPMPTSSDHSIDIDLEESADDSM